MNERKLSSKVELSAVDIERLNEIEWRKHVVESFAQVNERLTEGQACFRDIKRSINRVESNTSLARNVQVFSTATGIVYRTLARFAGMVVKPLIWFVAVAIFLYMMTHGGAIPLWAKPWLSFMEKMI